MRMRISKHRELKIPVYIAEHLRVLFKDLKTSSRFSSLFASVLFTVVCFAAAIVVTTIVLLATIIIPEIYFNNYYCYAVTI